MNFAYIHSRRRKLGMLILFQKCQLVYPNKVNSSPIRQFPPFSIFSTFSHYPGFQSIFISYRYWWFAAKTRQRGAKRREKKITSGHRSYESYFHVILGSYISSNRFGGDVHVCFHWRWQLRSHVTLRLRCMKKELRENCHEFFIQKIHFKFKVYKKDRSQLRSTHCVCF